MARKNSDNRKDRKVSLQSAVSAQKDSRLHHYAPPAKKAKRKEPAKVQPIQVDNPYALAEPATEKRPPKGARTVNPQARELIAPARQRIEIYASRRDVIAGMFARGQIDEAMYHAAIEYAGTYERAMAVKVKTIDPAAPVVSGGKGAEMLEAVIDASDRLKRLEARVGKLHGRAGVNLIRDVLGDGMTVEKAAKRRGGIGRPAVEWCGGTLRRCLEVLAEATGNAIRNAYTNRAREEERRDRLGKHQQHQDRERKKRGKARQQEVKHG